MLKLTVTVLTALGCSIGSAGPVFSAYQNDYNSAAIPRLAEIVSSNSMWKGSAADAQDNTVADLALVVFAVGFDTSGFSFSYAEQGVVLGKTVHPSTEIKYITDRLQVLHYQPLVEEAGSLVSRFSAELKNGNGASVPGWSQADYYRIIRPHDIQSRPIILKKSVCEDSKGCQTFRQGETLLFAKYDTIVTDSDVNKVISHEATELKKTAKEAFDSAVVAHAADLPQGLYKMSGPCNGNATAPRFMCFLSQGGNIYNNEIKADKSCNLQPFIGPYTTDTNADFTASKMKVDGAGRTINYWYTLRKAVDTTNTKFWIRRIVHDYFGGGGGPVPMPINPHNPNQPVVENPTGPSWDTWTYDYCELSPI